MALGRNSLDGKALIEIIERIEALKADQAAIGEDIKALMAGAKAAGFNPKGINFSVKVRALTPAQFREGEDVRDLYLHAIGFASEPQLYQQLDTMARDQLGRSEILQRLGHLVPIGGSIVVELNGPPVRLWRDADGNPHADEVRPQPLGGDDDDDEAPRGKPKAEVPAVDDEGAEGLGFDAGKEQKPIIANPFPFGDKRRRAWDAGWRRATGMSGLGPEEGEE